MASSGKKKRPSSGSSGSAGSSSSKGRNSRTGGSATPRAPKASSPTSSTSSSPSSARTADAGGAGTKGGARRRAKIPESARPQPRARGGSSDRSSSAATGAGNGGSTPTGNGSSKAGGRASTASARRRNGRSTDVEALDELEGSDEVEVIDGDEVEVIDRDEVEVIDRDGEPTGGPQTLKDRVTGMFSSLSLTGATGDDAPTRTRTKREPEIGPDGLKVPTWGLGDVAIAFVLSLLAYTISYLPLQALGYLPGVGGRGWPAGEVAGRVATGQVPQVTLGLGDAPAPLRILLNTIPLWLGLMVPTAYAVWRKGNGFVKDLGLSAQWLDLPLGLAIGVACQLVLMPLIYLVVNRLVPGQDVNAVAQQVTDQAVDPLSTILIFLVVGLGAPLVEEIYYRGLTLRAAERRFGPSWALLGTSAYFALMHGAPIVLPGLIVFALILGYLAQRFGRLGPSIFAHVGFNLVTAVVLIFGINFAWIA